MYFRLIAIVGFLFFMASLALGDEVRLRDGAVIHGKLIKVTKHTVLLTTESDTLAIDREGIEFASLDNGEIIRFGDSRPEPTTPTRASLGAESGAISTGQQEYFELDEVTLNPSSGSLYTVDQTIVIAIAPQERFTSNRIEEYKDYGGYKEPHLRPTCMDETGIYLLVLKDWRTRWSDNYEEPVRSSASLSCVKYSIVDRDNSEILTGRGTCVPMNSIREGYRITLKIDRVESDSIVLEDVLIELTSLDGSRVRLDSVSAREYDSP